MALNTGYHLAYLVAAALTTVAIVVAARALRPITDATTEFVEMPAGSTEPELATAADSRCASHIGYAVAD